MICLRRDLWLNSLQMVLANQFGHLASGKGAVNAARHAWWLLLMADDHPAVCIFATLGLRVRSHGVEQLDVLLRELQRIPPESHL